jgi:hypothetical protein
MQAHFGDVWQLCEQLAGSLAGTSVSLSGHSLSLPPRSPSHASEWHAQAIWPALKSDSGVLCGDPVFELEVPPQAVSICTVSTRGTHIEGGELQLEGAACVVFDSSCREVQLTGVKFKGAALPLA